MKKLLYLGVVIGVLAILGACGSIYENSPVGIGREYSELKKSPCACLELKKTEKLPDFLMTT